MLFPFAADVDADLVLCALYFEVSIPALTNVVLIHLLTVSGVTNEKLLYITSKNICMLQILLNMLYNKKTYI